jgi:predicted small metal-binding protein
MMSLSCKQMGEQNCDFVSTGEDRYQVEGKLLRHAMERHEEVLKGMNDGQWASVMRTMDEGVTEKE